MSHKTTRGMSVFCSGCKGYHEVEKLMTEEEFGQTFSYCPKFGKNHTALLVWGIVVTLK